MKVEQIAKEHGSLTKRLKALNENFSITLLDTGTDGGLYRRTIAENLNNEPVVMATSYTKLENTFFVELLAASKTKPIGEILFANNSKIIRNQMENHYINIKDIDNLTIKNYLYKVGYNAQTKIIYRHSLFIFEKQSMYIDEYFLPSLNKFTS